MRVLIFIALLGSAMAVPRQTERIVGGQDTTIDKYPFTANMLYGVLGIWWAHFCGGTLLSTRTVVSAAHCYEGDPARRWRVRLGSTFRESGGTVYNVESLILHEGYHGSHLDNDIAIIILASTVTFTDTISTARIAGITYILPDNTPVTAVGWGTLTYGGAQPDILQEVQVNTINQELCASRYAFLKTQPGYENYPDITDNMICAGILDVGGKDACHGDSGGPLLHAGDILIGITSWGFECADPFYPGVNVRVSALSNWIVANSL